VSYSILSAWSRGDIDRALAPYLGVEIEPTEAMAEGKRLHKKWERESLRTKRLPRVFGGRKLAKGFELENKVVRKINDWCVLSGVLDVYDGDTIIDYKSGKTSASSYLDGFQPEVYQVLRPNAKRFECYRFNQHLHKSDPDHVTMATLHLTSRTLRNGLEWILTNAAELREHLINNGYGDKLDQGKGLVE
jgi:hypothetical protein